MVSRRTLLVATLAFVASAAFAVSVASASMPVPASVASVSYFDCRSQCFADKATCNMVKCSPQGYCAKQPDFDLCIDNCFGDCATGLSTCTDRCARQPEEVAATIAWPPPPPKPVGVTCLVVCLLEFPIYAAQDDPQACIRDHPWICARVGEERQKLGVAKERAVVGPACVASCKQTANAAKTLCKFQKRSHHRELCQENARKVEQDCESGCQIVPSAVVGLGRSDPIQVDYYDRRTDRFCSNSIGTMQLKEYECSTDLAALYGVAGAQSAHIEWDSSPYSHNRYTVYFFSDTNCNTRRPDRDIVYATSSTCEYKQGDYAFTIY